MPRSFSSIAFLVIRVLLTVAFGAAGMAKLAGVDMMVASFDMIGWGQWFRYATGAIEVVSVVLLWVGGLQLVGAGLLLCTMIGAVLFHVLILGPSAVPAFVLGALCTALVWRHRPAAA